MSKKNNVVYTAIFGKRDVLLEPEFIPEGFDFVCFTDQNFKSKTWQIRRVETPFPQDLTRSNRFFKLLPHRFLSEYEFSIYIDGNIVVTGDISKLIEEYISGTVHMAALDSANYSFLPSRSVEEQMQLLLRPGQEERNKESYESIISQYQTYKAEGFPDNTGCIMGMLLVRRHNNKYVIDVMEQWWHEVQTKSKRDLMSFNYVAWKEKFPFNYMPFDGSNNSVVKKIRHYKPWHTRFNTRIKNRLHLFKRAYFK